MNQLLICDGNAMPSWGFRELMLKESLGEILALWGIRLPLSQGRLNIGAVWISSGHVGCVI